MDVSLFLASDGPFGPRSDYKEIRRTINGAAGLELVRDGMDAREVREAINGHFGQDIVVSGVTTFADFRSWLATLATPRSDGDASPRIG